MKALEDYIAFDLEFNQYEGAYQIIQVSAVRFTNGKEVDHYDSYVYTDKPLKSFINGPTGITQDKIQMPHNSNRSSTNSRPCRRPALIGYNAQKSDLPTLLENGLDLEDQYALSMSLTRLSERRPSDLHGIKNLQPTPLQNFWELQENHTIA